MSSWGHCQQAVSSAAILLYILFLVRRTCALNTYPILLQAVVKSMHNGQGKLFTACAKTEGQLAAALSEAFSADKSDHLAFIEVCVDTDDCSKELLEFGARVAHANSRCGAG